MAQAYAPYSRFQVGAALLFADGSVITGSNVENASYGLSLCAETVACAQASQAGRRGGLVAVAVIGGAGGVPDAPV
ncbi:cytidine deaminase, partial [Acinetobacter baumannii]